MELIGDFRKLFSHLWRRMREALIARAIRPAANALGALFLWAARRATARREKAGRLRTLWGFTPILTLPLLARCDRLLGLHSNSMVFTTYYITRDFDINLHQPDRVAAKLSRVLWSGSHQLFRKAVLVFVLLRYDVIHTFCDRAILLAPDRFGINRRELRALRAAGKRVYTYAYGADVRARAPTLALGSPNICEECPEPGKFCICDAKDLASSMDRLEGYTTARIAMGDMIAYVSECRDVHYWPLDLQRFIATPILPRAGRALRVAHAPNHPQFKGTRFLLAAIEQLQAEGHAIELVRVQGVPNEQVIALFENCDLVADQFVAGFHGYTALEAMALGRPVMCFLRGPTMAIDAAECPILNTHPDQVYDVLKACLTEQIDLDEVGRQSRRYIERNYSLEAVAARLGHLYLETATWSEPIANQLAARIRELEASRPGMLSPPQKGALMKASERN